MSDRKIVLRISQQSKIVNCNGEYYNLYFPVFALEMRRHSV